MIFCSNFIFSNFTLLVCAINNYSTWKFSFQSKRTRSKFSIPGAVFILLLTTVLIVNKFEQKQVKCYNEKADGHPEQRR
jgi:hypothetical protein